MRLTGLLVVSLLTLASIQTAAAQTTPEALAGALQTAARAGDGAAYHMLLSLEGTFAVEGGNFAADLGRTPQPTVTYQFSEVRADGPQSRASLALSWERQPGQLSRVSLPVVLNRQGDVWRYGGEAFVTLPARGFTLDILDVPGLPTRATSVAPLLPQAAAHVADVLGLQVPAAATVKVYPDMPTLSASVALSLQPVGGWNEPGEAIKLVLPGGNSPATELLRVLSHEFTHLSVSAAAGQGRDKRLPWWLHEGLADFVARAYWTPGATQSRRERVAGYARSGWVPLSELADFSTVPENRWTYVYAQGLGLVEFLAATKGQEAPMQLALAFADTGDADGAARALGFSSFADLETKTRAWLAMR
ncbi:hypothetical protein [Deinococcus humi]|uniref:Peptidase MA-like domain-containing protein n=1 Tax=Deinococcus humi TaxID=662880 RepID=A0A7W8JPU4_9DEIO|nr:hypothetical protein [Deinococcus humi]MBB5360937.1 hypothetical protein [Deinococcus humi]GGO17674.1 hypothetical protein GCM10008949_00070 [Deinococcus humi]